ncbi:hypothetical protein L1049_009082 [Liquidambar formosana]|uniref:Transposase n=1 Tax=Liquidambar formosana TaxID=63359 RepID=A0AAP0X8Q1_LIQFO
MSLSLRLHIPNPSSLFLTLTRNRYIVALGFIFSPDFAAAFSVACHSCNIFTVACLHHGCSQHQCSSSPLNRDSSKIRPFYTFNANRYGIFSAMCTFFKLCGVFRTIGKLKDTRHVTVEEITALFVHIIAHHVKNRVIINRFMRSGETISRHFNEVLKGVIWLQSHLLKQPEVVTETSTDPKWKWFKNYLGALDGTYIRINVLKVDKPRYRTRKNDIATNVLGVCSQDMQFTFVLPGWEGSAADSRVLRDAVSRRHGLKVPRDML